jgi:poly(hydroxyalkanoate) depolymerase family esterase
MRAPVSALLLLLGCSCVRVDADVDGEPAGRTAALLAGKTTTGSFGGRSYRLFTPSGYAAGKPLPLVLMLHGCTQDAAGFERGTQMSALGESQGFFVLYAEQPSSADANKCWEWWLPGNQARSGEPAQLAGLVQHVAGGVDIDPARVYVVGFSAGAAMSAILGATYPDVFAAIAVGSGLEYKAATSALDALTAMQKGGPSPATQGRAAYSAMGAARRAVPVIVFHGSSDTTVAPVNAGQIIEQWAKTDDLAADGVEDGSVSATPDSTTTATVPGGRSYSVSVHRDKKAAA